MGQAFSMAVRKSVTGIHITLSGRFTKHDLKSFSALINEAKNAEERIFLDVRKLDPINDKYCNDFKQCYAHIPSRNVIFKGYHSSQLEQIGQIGHQGNRILFMKESCKCEGACKSCACQSRAKNRDERFNFMKEKLTVN